MCRESSWACCPSLLKGESPGLSKHKNPRHSQKFIHVGGLILKVPKKFRELSGTACKAGGNGRWVTEGMQNVQQIMGGATPGEDQQGSMRAIIPLYLFFVDSHILLVGGCFNSF